MCCTYCTTSARVGAPHLLHAPNPDSQTPRPKPQHLNTHLPTHSTLLCALSASCCVRIPCAEAPAFLRPWRCLHFSGLGYARSCVGMLSLAMLAALAPARLRFSA